MANSSPSPASWPDGQQRIAVVVPCYGVRDQVTGVLERIGPEVSRIYCVDDACPEGTGRMLEAGIRDPRVRVLFHQTNQGVGGSTITGIRAALADGATVVVKVDGDGQMDPALIGRFVHPILAGQADYTKGNRFFHLADVRGMPTPRLAGNAVLSFVSSEPEARWIVYGHHIYADYFTVVGADVSTVRSSCRPSAISRSSIPREDR